MGLYRVKLNAGSRGLSYRLEAGSIKEVLARVFDLIADYPDGAFADFNVSIIREIENDPSGYEVRKDESGNPLKGYAGQEVDIQPSGLEDR